MRHPEKNLKSPYMKVDNIKVKPIPGFPGYYISRDGKVWSKKRHIWRKLSLSTTGGGLQIPLCKNGERTTKTVGRLVLEAWLCPCPEGMECCHNDGDTCNNNLENLRWDTHQANMADADKWKHGRLLRRPRLQGEACSWSKLTAAFVYQIRHILKETHIADAEVARAYSVSTTCIRRIRLEKTWRHLL